MWIYVESTTATVQLSPYVQSTPGVTFIFGGSVTAFPGTSPTWAQLIVAVPGASASWDPTVVNQWGLQVTEVGTTNTSAQVVIAIDDCLVE